MKDIFENLQDNNIELYITGVCFLVVFFFFFKVSYVRLVKMKLVIYIFFNHS